MLRYSVNARVIYQINLYLQSGKMEILKSLSASLRALQYQFIGQEEQEFVYLSFPFLSVLQDTLEV